MVVQGGRRMLRRVNSSWIYEVGGGAAKGGSSEGVCVARFKTFIVLERKEQTALPVKSLVFDWCRRRS